MPGGHGVLLKQVLAHVGHTGPGSGVTRARRTRLGGGPHSPDGPPGPDTWSGAHEPAVQALLRIGTEGAYEHVLAFCCGTKHFYPWHVGALDAVAAARGIRLGPQLAF